MRQRQQITAPLANTIFDSLREHYFSYFSYFLIHRVVETLNMRLKHELAAILFTCLKRPLRASIATFNNGYRSVVHRESAV